MRDTGADRLAVLFKADAKRSGDVELVRFAHKAHRRRPSIQHRRQHIIILGRPPYPLGHAKGGHGGEGLLRMGEEFRVRRVRPRPTALDIIYAQRIQRLGDLLLLGGRELHALRLLPVAQGGVEEVETLAGHSSASRLRVIAHIPASFTISEGTRVTLSFVIRTSTPAAVSCALYRSTGVKFLVFIALFRQAVIQA